MMSLTTTPVKCYPHNSGINKQERRRSLATQITAVYLQDISAVLAPMQSAL